MIVLLDNGHGSSTAGKRSPDGRLREWSYTREITARIEKKLNGLGIEVMRIVTEDKDVPLVSGADSRVKRVNEVCRQRGKYNVILVSVHCNAAGNGGQWMSARGWSVHIAPNASSKSKELADLAFDEARRRGLVMRQPMPQQKYWVQNLAICRDTNCPAILTENLFQDNMKDVDFLLSEQGKETIADLHVDAIVKYIMFSV